MALTPEDVLNKSFTATQFRRGYDEQEVDDFLDEVVVELRRLLAENSDLRRRVDSEAGGAAGGEPIDSAGEARMAQFAADVQQAEQEAAARIAKAVAQAEQAEQEARERVSAAAEQGQQADQAARTVTQVSTPPSGATDAAGVIALAQRLHDEYVNQGRAEHDRLVGEAAAEHERLVGEASAERERLLREGQSRHDELLRTGEERHKELVSSAQEQHDRLIAEARGTHERMITEARERSTGMLAEAQQKRQSVLDDLEREQGTMSERIAQLTAFEADYRTRLRGFMERQLQHLQAPTDDGPAGVASPEMLSEQHELEPVPAEDGSR